MAKDHLVDLQEIMRLRNGTDGEREAANGKFKDLVRSFKQNVRVKATRSRAAARAKELKREATVDGVTTCEGCGWSVPERIGSRAMHQHHVIEVANGGNNKRSNLVVICPNCHVIAHALADKLGPKAPRDRDSLLALLKADPLSLLRR